MGRPTYRQSFSQSRVCGRAGYSLLQPSLAPAGSLCTQPALNRFCALVTPGSRPNPPKARTRGYFGKSSVPSPSTVDPRSGISGCFLGAFWVVCGSFSLQNDVILPRIEDLACGVVIFVSFHGCALPRGVAREYERQVCVS